MPPENETRRPDDEAITFRRSDGERLAALEQESKHYATKAWVLGWGLTIALGVIGSLVTFSLNLALD